MKYMPQDLNIDFFMNSNALAAKSLVPCFMTQNEKVP